MIISYGYYGVISFSNVETIGVFGICVVCGRLDRSILLDYELDANLKHPFKCLRRDCDPQ